MHELQVITKIRQSKEYFTKNFSASVNSSLLLILGFICLIDNASDILRRTVTDCLSII